MIKLVKINLLKVKFRIIKKTYKFLIISTRFNIRINLMNNKLINITIITKISMVMNTFSIIPQKNDIA